MKVSRATYESVKSEKENLEYQKNTLEGRKDLFRYLPDGGEKVKIKIQGLVKEIKAKQDQINLMIIDERG